MMMRSRTTVEGCILRTSESAQSSECTVIGYLADRPILATVIDSLGDRYHYVGVASRLSDGRFDVKSLLLGEWIVEPGLIYLSEEALLHSTRTRKVARQV
jgi:hypothetical protein